MRSARYFAALCAVLSASCDDTGGIEAVKARVWFEPERIAFGTIRVGDDETIAAKLMTAGTSATSQIEARFSENANSYSVRTAEGRALNGAFAPSTGEVDINLIFGPGEEGELSTTLVVRIGEAEATLVIAGAARFRRPATPEVDPTSIDFGNVELGRDAVRRFNLINVGEDRGVLREVRPKSPDTMVPFAVTTRGGGNPVPSELEPDRTQTLELEAHFEPTAVGTFEEDLELVFDGGNSATLRVRGAGVPAGMLACDSTSIDFGPVERGSSARRSVHCTVSGGAFSIERIGPGSTSSAQFSVPNAPSSVQNDVLDFDVMFDARGVALVHTGVIEILSAHGSLTRIDVRGEVIPPAPGTTDLSVTLTWNTDATDLDVHLVRSGGAPFDGMNDCYYAAKNPDWGLAEETLDDPFLDNDETEGFGPEQINLTSAAEEQFDLYVHFYDYSSSRPPPTLVSMQVNLRGVDLGVFTQTLDFCGATWHVGRFNFGQNPATFMSDSVVTSAYRSRASTRCQ